MAIWGKIAKAAAQMVFPRMARAFAPVRKVVEAVERLGIKYSPVDIITDYTDWRELYENQPKVESLGRSVKPSKEIMAERDLGDRAKYRIIMNIKYKNIATGEVFMAPASMYTNQLRTYAGWEREFRAQYAKRHGEYEITPVEISPIMIMHNELWEY